MSVPAVLLLIFRRADLAKKQIEALRAVRPARIYVAADGPRPAHPGDWADCRAVRRALDDIDWPCQVKTLFRSNLGLKLAVSQAIDWFFEAEEEGIVLEEDCLPHPDFFSFCDALLLRYRDNPRVMQISGSNFQPGPRTGQSYFFSRYNHVWGWATWRRAWLAYRPQMEDLEVFLAEADCAGFWENRREKKYWTKIFRSAKENRVQSWAYRWTFTLWAEGGLCVYPEVNLITNLGFGTDATNTRKPDRRKTERRLAPLGTMTHPSTLMPLRNADRWTFEHLYWGDPLPRFIHHLEKLVQVLGASLAKPGPGSGSRSIRTFVSRNLSQKRSS